MKLKTKSKVETAFEAFESQPLRILKISKDEPTIFEEDKI